MNKRAMLFDLFIFICAIFSFIVPLLISFVFYTLFNAVGLVELTAPIMSVVFIASMFCIAAGLVALREKVVGD